MLLRSFAPAQYYPYSLVASRARASNCIQITNQTSIFCLRRQVKSKERPSVGVLLILVRVPRIELGSTHWKCVILPLNHTRNFKIVAEKTLNGKEMVVEIRRAKMEICLKNL